MPSLCSSSVTRSPMSPYIRCPGFCGWFLEHTSLDTLALVANVTCVHEFNWMVAKKLFVTGCLPRAQCRRQKWSSPRKSILYTLIVTAWMFGFQPACIGYWLRSSPLVHWQVLANSQLLGAPKNKEVSLISHKDLRHNQQLRQGWKIRFIFHTRPLRQDCEMAI